MKSLSGMLFCASGIVLMCCMDAVAKALGADLTTFQVVFLRYLGAALWLILWIALTGASWPKREDLGRQAQRAALLVVTASLFFYAVTHLPLAVVAALGMTAPVYVTLLGAIFFHEKIGPAPGSLSASAPRAQPPSSSPARPTPSPPPMATPLPGPPRSSPHSPTQSSSRS